MALAFWLIALLQLEASKGQVQILVDPLAHLVPRAESDSLCDRHLQLLQNNLANPLVGIATPDLFWPQMMADATGKFTEGISQLNVKAYGNSDECINIQVSNPGNGTDSFMGRYIVFAIQQLITTESKQLMGNNGQLLKLKRPQEKMAALLSPNDVLAGGLAELFGVGVCVPDSCSELQIQAIIEENYNEKHNNAALKLRFWPSITRHRKAPEYDDFDRFMIGFFAALAFLIVVGTVTEAYQSYRSRKNESLLSGNWAKFLLGFGVYNNTQKWLNTDMPKGSDHLSCLDGVRFLSMTWVVLGHSCAETMNLPLKNALSGVIQTVSESFWMQVITNAFPSVDSFFLISGTLLSYLTLKELDKKRGKINIPLFYIHRYLRLTGTYIVIIGFHASFLRHWNFGPMNNLDSYADGCRKEWWKNVLYVNNFGQFFGENVSICIGQTWYLANDFQMFLVSLLFIWPLWKFPKGGLAFSGVTVAVSIIVPTALTAVNSWPATVAFMADIYYYEWFYVKPWCRFSPYIIGIILGHLLHVTKNKPLKINPIVNIWIWATAFATGFAVIYGLNTVAVPSEGYSSLVNVFYGGFHRAAWALALSWVIFACSKGYGGWINRLLSWPAFLPLSRISYIIYLMHFVIIESMKSVQTHFVDGTNTYMTIFFLDVLVITALLSAFIFVFIEMPWLNTEKLVFSILLGDPKSAPKDNDTTPDVNGHPEQKNGVESK